MHISMHYLGAMVPGTGGEPPAAVFQRGTGEADGRFTIRKSPCPADFSGDMVLGTRANPAFPNDRIGVC